MGGVGGDHKTPPIQHDGAGLINHSFLISAQELRRHWVAGVLGTELHLVPTPLSSPFLFFLTHFETQADQSLHLQMPPPPLVNTQWRLIPEETQHHSKQKVVIRHLSLQQMKKHTDIRKSRPSCMVRAALLLTLFDMKKKHSIYTLRHSLTPYQLIQ